MRSRYTAATTPQTMPGRSFITGAIQRLVLTAYVLGPASTAPTTATAPYRTIAQPMSSRIDVLMIQT